MDKDTAEVRGWRALGARCTSFMLGPVFARRLALTHAIDDFADSLVNISLAGSLFLSVSLDSSRDRILLFLVLAAAPLAVVAPAVGATLDRTRAGYRMMVAGSQATRAALALFMAGSLLSVAVYPLAFGILLCRKAYSLSKAALLSQMTLDRGELVAADSHIARTGTIVGGLGTALGGLLLALDSANVILLVAAPMFALSAVVSMGLPRPKRALSVAVAPRLSEIIPANIWVATIAVAAIRASAGALTYLLAFAIKRGGGATWIFAAGLVAAGLGGFVANLVSSRLHRWMAPDRVLVLALLVPGCISVVGVVTIGHFGVMAIAFAIGLGNGVASRSITVLQASVARLARGRVIARSELVFQLAGLLGAVLAVLVTPSPRIGLAFAAVFLILAGVFYLSSLKLSLRDEASRFLLGTHAPSVASELPFALVLEAERLATLGAYRMAVVVADSAVRVVNERRPECVSSTSMGDWNRLRERVGQVMHDDSQPASEFVVDVIQAARRVVEGTADDADTNVADHPVLYTARNLV